MGGLGANQNGKRLASSGYGTTILGRSYRSSHRVLLRPCPNWSLALSPAEKITFKTVHYQSVAVFWPGEVVALVTSVSTRDRLEHPPPTFRGDGVFPLHCRAAPETFFGKYSLVTARDEGKTKGKGIWSPQHHRSRCAFAAEQPFGRRGGPRSEIASLGPSRPLLHAQQSWDVVTVWTDPPPQNRAIAGLADFSVHERSWQMVIWGALPCVPHSV